MPPGDGDVGNSDPQRKRTVDDALRAGVALSARETVARYGSAAAEHIIGYRGVDNETGKTYAKSLSGISKYKINPDPAYAENNYKQQAGFSAEVAATSRDNSEAIIKGSPVRTSRSDDLPQYGKNHNVVDRVQILDGKIIAGSESQMKFVGDRDALFKDIAKDDGKFSRYRGVKLELPSEQFEGASGHCRRQATLLREQAQEVEKLGKLEVAAKLRREADNYEQLADNVRDSGLTTDDALFYRKHPDLATLRDIARTGHRAGIEGARYGALIGGCASLLKHAFAAAQGKCDVRQATNGVAVDAAKAGVMGYATAATGATIKAVMQQSGNQAVRTLANTSAPTLVVNICLSLGSSIKRYIAGELTETQLLIEVGEKGSGMLSSGMMAALGQVVIPVPFVGAAIGGMVGYTLSSLFYQSAVDTARGAEMSRVNLSRVRAIEAAARERIAEEQAALNAFVQSELPQLFQETRQLFVAMDTPATGGIDALSAAVNQYAGLLGKQLQFQTLSEFDAFMASDDPLRL